MKLVSSWSHYLDYECNDCGETTHAYRGCGARFSLHDGVPLQQVQNLPKKARSTCKRQPLRPDWNTGRLSGMQSTVNHVNTATTGMSPDGNALHHDAWTKNG